MVLGTVDGAGGSWQTTLNGKVTRCFLHLHRRAAPLRS